MITINEHYLKLQASYLFSDIARRVAAFQEAHPDRQVIRLGIGDVTRALPPACIDAFHRAVDEMAVDSNLPGLRSGAGLRLPARGHCPSRLPGTGRRGRSRTRSLSRTGPSATPATSRNSSPWTAGSPSRTRSIRSTSTPMSWPGEPGSLPMAAIRVSVYLDSTRDNNYVPDLPNGRS